MTSRAPWVIDFIALAMVLIVPVLAYSIVLVRRRKAYAVHRKIQLVMGSVLLVTIAVFEVNIRLFGWRQYASASPYYDTVLFPCLAGHIVLATVTTMVWIWLIVTALKHFPRPPAPNAFSRRHKRVAWAGSLLMLGTSVSGWLFYYMAFVAE